MAGLLEGKNLLVTGVLTDASIGFHVARLAQEQGARIVVSGFGRMSLTERIIKRLPELPPLIEVDVTQDDHLARLPDQLREHLPQVDGVLHSIGYAPPGALGGNFLNTTWADVATALHVSTYSLQSLTMACRPLFPQTGASIVGLTFDASVAWPTYDWMGVAKAGLESCSRYLARELGPSKVRCNIVAAGPLRTVAAKAIPGFEGFEDVWNERAPLGWSFADPVPAAMACIALMSDWFPATTGEIVHVDGGVHAVGA